MASPPADHAAPLTWDCSPADYRVTSLLRYLPFVFLGGYVGIGLVAGALALPGLLGSPELLALVALLALVGGPMSLLYLLPMLRDPDQRPDLDSRGWYEGISPVGVLLAAAAGTALTLAGAALTGGASHFLGVVVFLAIPVFLLGVVDGEGQVDPSDGTLTYRESTVDVTRIDGVRTWQVGSLVLVWLDYVPGTSGPRPRLLSVPADVADDIVDALRAGARTNVDVEQRDPDRLAQATLAVTSLLFFGVALGAYLSGVSADARPAIAFVTGGIGLAFLLAALVLS